MFLNTSLNKIILMMPLLCTHVGLYLGHAKQSAVYTLLLVIREFDHIPNTLSQRVEIETSKSPDQANALGPTTRRQCNPFFLRIQLSRVNAHGKYFSLIIVTGVCYNKRLLSLIS